jgi:hypothetical protein
MTTAINLAAESSRTTATPRPTNTPFPVLRRRVDSARRAVRFFFDATIGAAIAFIFALFGIESFEIGARRGYVQLCENGCNEVHDADEICPRALIADCSLCARSAVDLDAAGNCSHCGARGVVNRRSKKTGKRLRPSHLKLTEARTSLRAGTHGIRDHVRLSGPGSSSLHMANDP